MGYEIYIQNCFNMNKQFFPNISEARAIFMGELKVPVAKQ